MSGRLDACCAPQRLVCSAVWMQRRETTTRMELQLRAVRSQRDRECIERERERPERWPQIWHALQACRRTSSSQRQHVSTVARQTRHNSRKIAEKAKDEGWGVSSRSERGELQVRGRGGAHAVVDGAALLARRQTRLSISSPACNPCHFGNTLRFALQCSKETRRYEAARQEGP